MTKTIMFLGIAAAFIVGMVASGADQAFAKSPHVDFPDTYIATETKIIRAYDGGNVVAQCDDDDVLLSGGYVFWGADLIVKGDQPIPVGKGGMGWQVGATNPSATDGNIILRIICADTSP